MKNYGSNLFLSDDFLSSEEINQLIKSIKKIPMIESGTGGAAPEKITSNSSFNPTNRRSQVKWIPKIKDYKWIYEKLVNFAKDVNKKEFFLNITNYECIQYTEYSEKDWGTYNWHIDSMKVNGDNFRKLSCVIFLDDEFSFTGGNFLIDSGGEVKHIPQKKGSIVIFNSHMSHCVTPIIYGKRKSLVFWLSGPIKQ